MVRYFGLTAAVLLLASCAQGDDGGTAGETATTDMAESDAYASPDIAPSAAPGVAFNYRYAFRLPNTRIAAVQERHAQACEQLGLDRCRIAGLRYRLVDRDKVEAQLTFKLEPTIARQFGKDAIAIVGSNEGMLVDSEISGTDAGAAISASQARSTQLRADLAALEAQAKAPGVAGPVRAERERQAEELRAQLRRETQGRSTDRESLATTPMTFDYGSGSLIPGFDGSSPLRDSWRSAIGSFVHMIGIIIVTIGFLLPWLLLVTLLMALWRSAAMVRLRRWITIDRVAAKPIDPNADDPVGA